MKINRVLFILLFATFLWGCGKSSDRPQGKTASASMAVEGIIVRAESLSTVVQASGTLLPFEETVVYPEVSGRIVSVSIPEGQKVRKGDLLVKLFDADLQAQLKKTEAQINLAKETEKRLAELLTVNGVAKQEYDQSMMQLRVLEADADIIRVSISRTEIRAPFDGIVGLKKVSVGALVNSQIPICTIRSAAQLKLDFAIPEKYGSLVQSGKEVTFTLGGDTNVYIAKVMATEQSVEMETRNLRIRANVTSNSSSLIPGAFAYVQLPLGIDESAISIPTQCLIPQGRKKVVIVNRSGKAIFTPVETGVRQNDKIEITNGLQVGDTIASTGILFLRPNSPLVFSNLK
ncbi:MAG: efflux RND transporter periplasmic adaptor subunit [Flavobacteriales bacterium]|nr:efflux RND transporter periplasmic adaptor subunit [Flavobacteriales bacterium]